MPDVLAVTTPAPAALEPIDVRLPAKTGRKHGTSSRHPFDRWFRYPAGFASDHVEYLLKVLGVEEGTVIDCFAGSGVTGTAARAVGLGFYGIEAHPMIAELASLKLQVDVEPDTLRQVAAEIAGTAKAREASVTANDLSKETELVSRSFDPVVLTQLVALRHTIVDREPDEMSIYMKWALLGTLRDVATVKVGWPYQLPGKPRQARFADVGKRFLERVEWMAEDVAELAEDRPSAIVRLGDSREASSWPKPGTAQASIASPPYLNNFDYADATRLEAYFWGEVRSWKELTTTIRGDMITASTQQSSVLEKEAALKTLEGLPEIHETVTELAAALKAERRQRPAGAKAYDQVVPAYFLAMSQILENLYLSFDHGAVAVWQIGDSAPYGVFIDTPGIIGRIAEAHGFRMISDTVIRERGQRWRRANSPVGVTLAERVICFRKD
ncbi:DNA methyltransferase [Microbacterium sp. GCS4]|uniref:DNA methyltransferase n=1 Tax=Microbacterium sp. GCS4 TaxID=1692239 RepID=UPI0009E4E51E|nr:DNA methyltransferase [Microbacterium sp. GCS4]